MPPFYTYFAIYPRFQCMLYFCLVLSSLSPWSFLKYKFATKVSIVLIAGMACTLTNRSSGWAIGVVQTENQLGQTLPSTHTSLQSFCKPSYVNHLLAAEATNLPDMLRHVEAQYWTESVLCCDCYI